MRSLSGSTRWVVAVLIVCMGCRTTHQAAVMMPANQDQEGADCLRRCDYARAGGLDAYLGCARACPRVLVREPGDCDWEQPAGQVCRNEWEDRFSPGKTIGLIVLINVVGFLLLVPKPTR